MTSTLTRLIIAFVVCVILNFELDTGVVSARPCPTPLVTIVVVTATPVFTAPMTPTLTPTSTPTPTVARTATASVTPTGTTTCTATPTPAPTPSVARYFAPSGSDGSACTIGAPCATIAKATTLLASAIPGEAILFQRNGIWVGGFTLPTHLNGTISNPIVIGNYGSGALPKIDGGGRTSGADGCFYARANGGGGTPLWSYLTIDGFECTNAKTGVKFYQDAGGSIGMPGIIVQNMYIHATGPLTDDLTYNNQLMFLDENKGVDGVKFLNNVVSNCGGHNCIQIHKDYGAPLIQGNYCAGPWIHNCIDVKSSIGVLVKGNTVNGAGASGGSAFYYENVDAPVGDITWQNNVAYNSPNGYECEWGGTGSGVASVCHAFNNTAYLINSSAMVTGGDPSCGDVTFDIRNNILDTTSTFFNGHSCITPTWDYNNDGGTRGVVGGPSGAHDLHGVNPMYVNQSTADFRLASGSPCIGTGLAGLTPGNNNIGAK